MFCKKNANFFRIIFICLSLASVFGYFLRFYKANSICNQDYLHGMKK